MWTSVVIPDRREQSSIRLQSCPGWSGLREAPPEENAESHDREVPSAHEARESGSAPPRSSRRRSGDGAAASGPGAAGARPRGRPLARGGRETPGSAGARENGFLGHRTVLEGNTARVSRFALGCPPGVARGGADALTDSGAGLAL